MNVVLITIDTLRADHCGFQGYERNTTPRLDTFAEESVVFERAYAPSNGTRLDSSHALGALPPNCFEMMLLPTF